MSKKSKKAVPHLRCRTCSYCRPKYSFFWCAQHSPPEHFYFKPDSIFRSCSDCACLFFSFVPMPVLRQILSGTTFYRIDGYDSLYVVDLENDPPYVQLELFKVRDFQNWEDLIIEGSTFSPGGAQ